MNDSTNLTGKVVLITGGTDGIGKATALEMAQRGAQVVIVGRNAAKGAEVVKAGGQAITFVQADLSLMAEVRRVTETFRAAHNRLDILIHSVGVILTKRQLTPEGLEATFATDYLSRFLLTELLLDLLKASTPSRIINVAAAGGGMGSLNFEDIQGERKIGGMRGLGQAQYANDVFTLELGRRLAGTGITTIVMMPGLVDTAIRRDGPKWLTVIGNLIAKPFAITPTQSGKEVVWLATTPELENTNGALFNRKKRITPSAKTADPQLGQQLWQVSDALTRFAI